MMTTNTTKGFTLLEVMVALVIFSIGLIGLAGMQGLSLQNNQVAYKRTIATQLAYDIADRIRANNFPGVDYTHTTPATLTAPSPLCISTTANACTSAQMATWDLFEWDTAIRDTANSNLANAKGMISKTTTTYTISIGWDETKTGLTGTYDCTATPPTPAGLECVNLVVEL